MTDSKTQDWIFHLRPLHISTLVALYLLGAGFARYLGAVINLQILAAGLLLVCSLGEGFFFLGDYLGQPIPAAIYRDENGSRSGGSAPEDQPPNQLLLLSVLCLAAAGLMVVVLGSLGAITPALLIVLGLTFGGFVWLTLPGIAPTDSGWAEFMTSMLMVVFAPAAAYLLQTGEFHRFLTLGVFPLFPLHLALVLVIRLRSFPEDLARSRKTLLVRLGWIRAVFLHNLLVLSGFALFGAALLFGMPARLVSPLFLALPAAGYLVWYLSQLESGAPVRWPLINLLSRVVFFLPVYLLLYSSWIR